MARPKKQVKAKEPVRLRFNKLKNGNTSIYLDIYHDGRRSYQFLKLYLVPEDGVAAKIQNANTMAKANAIKAERILELTNKVAGITDRSYKAKMLFTDWMRIYRDKVAEHSSIATVKTVERIISEVEKYNGEVILAEVDRNYIMGFIEWLGNREMYKVDKGKLKKASVGAYVRYIRAALNYAVKENILRTSPFKSVKTSTLSETESKREYLTVDEVKRLIATPCQNRQLKAAFLFSCFCGLRISDLESLCWKHIIKNNGKWQVEITQFKTGIQLYLPLNMNARKWLPKQSGATPDTPVFPKLNRGYKTVLCDWVEKAGIYKHVCFHTSRHTFATLALTAGVDIYTTSQLLGHTTIRHTQRYAKIINSKKDDAVSLLDNAFVQ